MPARWPRSSAWTREVIRTLLTEKFSAKQSLMDSNRKAVDIGYNYAKEHFACPLPIRLEPMDATKDSILIDGNTSAALGCVYAGATVAAWYPITPSTSLMDGFRGFCKRFRRDTETKKNLACIIQAEDELAAIGMVIGAGWAGARAFTSTSGPGISLMNEFIGLAYYAEVPAVVFDVQRTGPSTGMPTRTQQGDLLLCAYASHGDTRHICLYPADPREAFELSVKAFDLADRFQTPVFVLSDLDIGMNDWMIPKLTWDDSYQAPIAARCSRPRSSTRSRRSTATSTRTATVSPTGRYPGTHPKGAYFTRGSGHNSFAGYTEDDAEYTEVVDRIARKIQSAARAVPAPIMQLKPGASMGIVTIGGCHGACVEALDQLAARASRSTTCASAASRSETTCGGSWNSTR